MLRMNFWKCTITVWSFWLIMSVASLCTYREATIRCTQVDKEQYLSEVYQLSAKIRESAQRVKLYSLEITNSSLPVIGSWISSPFKYNSVKLNVLNISQCKVSKIEKDAFSGNSFQLNELTLSYANLKDFKFLESILRMNSFKLINSNLDVANFVENLRKTDIVRLSLSGCRIDYIDLKSFPSLNYDLSHNLLTDFNCGRCEGRVNLSYNRLNKVKITSAGSLDVSGNRNLVSLSGQYNDINISDLKSHFSLSLLQNITISQSIVLRNNVIKKLDKSVFNISKIFNNIATQISIDLSQISLTYISDLYFSRYKLQILNLSGNNVKRIGACAFCNASIDTLDLSSSRISHITANTFDGLQVVKLNLSHNNLRYLKQVFDNIYVNEIDLSFNPIKRIDSSTFKYSRRLKFLNLSNTYVTDIGADTFSNLSTLNSLEISLPSTFQPESIRSLFIKYLTIRNSKFSTLQDGCFVGLYGLESLTFVNSSADKIGQRYLKGLFNLRQLTIIKPTKGIVFEDLYSLSELDLSNSYLIIQKNSFEGLVNIVSLNLSGNGLSTIPDGSFDYLGRVESLDLSKNRLSDIPVALFANMTSLKYLNLSDNSLSSLAPDVFYDIKKNLIYLDLSYNHLQFTVINNFHGLTNIRSLNLDVESKTGWITAASAISLISYSRLSLHSPRWCCLRII